MPKSLEVTIDGTVVGICTPQPGSPISVYVGNIPKKYMRVQCVCWGEHESWFWQLKDVKENETVSFRLIDTKKNGWPPRVKKNPSIEKRSESERTK